MRAVSEWPRPVTLRDLRGFLGLSGYYRRFLKGYAEVAAPLQCLLQGQEGRRKGTKVSKGTHYKGDGTIREKWNSSCETAFAKLKQMLTEAPVLGFPDFSCGFILETDASFNGLGAVLSQKQENVLVVLGYASRALKPCERNMQNYSSMKLELLALYWAVTQKYRHLLLGTEFIVFTDNNPLSYLQTTAKLGATETRWAAELAQVTFTIKYRSGRSNKNADALSRKVHHGEEPPVARLEEIASDSFSLQGRGRGTLVPECVRVCAEDTIASALLQESRIRSTVVAPQAVSTFPSISHKDMAVMQKGDEATGRLWYHWQRRHPPTLRQLMKEPKPARKLLREWKCIREEHGVLYRVVQINGQGARQLILPGSLKRNVLKSIHDHLGHQAVEKTTALARSRFYWPGMMADVADYCRTCGRCTLAKAGKKLHPTMSSLTATRPLEILAVDFTLLERSTGGIGNVLVLTDVFTKYTQAIPTKDQKATTVARVLVKEWIVRFGVPKRIHSDQGRNFESKVIQELCKMASLRVAHPRTIQRVTVNVNASIEPCMTVCVLCFQRRNVSGQNFFQNLCLHTTVPLTQLLATRPTTCSSAGSRHFQWII